MFKTRDTPEDPEDLVREHRDLYERLAASDLPIAEDCQRALDAVEADDE